MSSQTNVGIISNCLLNKAVTSGSGLYSFRNDLAFDVEFDADHTDSVRSGQNHLESFHNTNLCTVTNTDTGTVRIWIMDDNLPHDFYASWMPICTVTSMCNGSQSYIAGGTSLTIKYFGDQYTIYKLDATGTFSVVSKSLITNASLGKYWQFTATTNDFVVVSTGTSQVQLKFVETGFYYFPDMSTCSNAVWLGAKTTTTSKLSTTTVATSSSKSQTTTMLQQFASSFALSTTQKSIVLSSPSTTTIRTSILKSTLLLSVGTTLPKSAEMTSLFYSSMASSFDADMNGSSSSSFVPYTTVLKNPETVKLVTKAASLEFFNAASHSFFDFALYINIFSLVRLFISFGLIIYILTTLNNLRVIRKRLRHLGNTPKSTIN